MKPHETAVAIVDDDPAVCTALWRLIMALGHEAHVFSSGEELLAESEVARHYHFLLDYHLPGLSGPPLVQRIRARWPDARILVMSGLEGANAGAACFAAGANFFVRKPLKPADLQTLLGASPEWPRFYPM